MGKYTRRKIHQALAGKVDEGGKVTVRLVAPHEHAGTELQPGAIIDLQPDQAEKLVALEIAIPYQRSKFSTED